MPRRTPSSWKADKDEVWASILTKSTSAADFLRRCKLEQPNVFAKRFKSLRSVANHEWPMPPMTYEPKWLDFPNLPEEIFQWMLKNLCCLNPPHRARSLVIEGPPRTGKTEWARSLGPHNYFSGGWMDFRHYNNAAKYNVIDNIEFKKCKNVKQLLGCQEDYTADMRYGKPIRVKGGIPSIVVVNLHMSWDSQFTPAFRQWFDGNADYVKIYQPFF